MLRRSAILSLLVFLAVAVSSPGAPLTVNEIQFLLRQATPSAEILRQAAERKLFKPLDAAEAKTLKDAGATDYLIRTLASPAYVLSDAEAAKEAQRQLLMRERLRQEVSRDEAAQAERAKREEEIALNSWLHGKIADMLGEKLVRLDGDNLKPVANEEIRDVKVFVFYRAAFSSEPCRIFSKQLVVAYRELKQKYPKEFEVILLSQDGDQWNMQAAMRKARMPWPAVKFDETKEFTDLYCGAGLPWLVLVAESGKPITLNGANKLFIEPDSVLAALEGTLEKLKN